MWSVVRGRLDVEKEGRDDLGFERSILFQKRGHIFR